MAYESGVIERETIQEELIQVFDGATAQVLGRVLGRMAARTEELRVTREEFRAPRAMVADLAAAQQRAEERLARLEATVQRLAEAQQRTEETVQRLVEAQQRTEETVQRLVEAQQRTEEEVRQLAGVQGVMAQDMAAIKGRQLELTYQQRAGAYFGPLLRRVRALLPFELEDNLESHLTPDEFRDLLRLDLLVRGRPRYREGAPEVWLAVEVSAVIDRHDVERALRRADYLQQAGYRAIPTVTGERMTEGAEHEVKIHNVLTLLDGGVLLWEEALDAALSKAQPR